MDDHNSANEFVTKMEGGTLDGKLSIELARLSYDELAEVERILIDRMKSKACSAKPGRELRSPSALVFI